MQTAIDPAAQASVLAANVDRYSDQLSKSLHGEFLMGMDEPQLQIAVRDATHPPHSNLTMKVAAGRPDARSDPRATCSVELWFLDSQFPAATSPLWTRTTETPFHEFVDSSSCSVYLCENISDKMISPPEKNVHGALFFAVVFYFHMTVFPGLLVRYTCARISVTR